MSPWFVLAFLLAWVASIGGTYRYAETVGEDRVTAQQKKQDDIVRETREAAQTGAAAAIAANRPKNVTIRQETEREIQTNTFYAECRHSPDQLRRINEAIAGHRPEPAGSGLVPRNAPFDGGRLRGDHDQADRLRNPVLGLPDGSAR